MSSFLVHRFRIFFIRKSFIGVLATPLLIVIAIGLYYVPLIFR